jgi:TetR/AcrR family transcriptional repressor of nem operon
MPRPKLFDRDLALQRAIELFRQQGFAGTSTEALLKTMGISRQSMYDTFGDKRRLYLEALCQYNAASVAAQVRTLNKASSSRRGLEEMLVKFASNAVTKTNNHCLGVSSISEFGRSDQEINALNDASGQIVVNAIAKAVTEAQMEGEIYRDLKPKAVAGFLMSLLSGMKVSARAGASLSSLRETASLGMRALI